MQLPNVHFAMASASETSYCLFRTQGFIFAEKQGEHHRIQLTEKTQQIKVGHNKMRKHQIVCRENENEGHYFEIPATLYNKVFMPIQTELFCNAVEKNNQHRTRGC